MGAPFPQWTNTAFRLGLGSLAAIAIGGPLLLMVWMRTPWITNEGVPVEQPVSFDHRHHVKDDGIDCRYCHLSVETSAAAGIPPTTVCMNCHSQIWTASPLLKPVRDSYFEERTIAWRRVNALPDFVFFNHSIHVNKGIGCSSCHGRVDEMAQTAKGSPLTMSWCLDCHRSPEAHVRPLDAVTSMDWQDNLSPQARAALAKQYELHPTTNCTTCHR